MTVRHIGNRDDWYIISTDHGEGKRPAWRGMGVSLHGPNIEARAEWSLLSRGFGVGFEVGRNGGESDIGLNVYAGPLASLWLRLRAPWTARLRVERERDPEWWHYPRHTGIRLFPHRGRIVQVKIEDRDGVWSKGQPWWRDFGVSVSDVLGKNHTETTTLDSGVCRIPLPEGVYFGEWERKRYVTRYTKPLGKLRDLLAGPRTHETVMVNIPGGIPVQGKGENSWDCGMDGVFGTSGATLADAVANVVRSVTRDRQRYGGPHNLPRPMTVAEAAAVPQEGADRG